MKQTCSNQLTGELVAATDKTTTDQLARSNQIRIRATQAAASIEPNHTTLPLSNAPGLHATTQSSTKVT